MTLNAFICRPLSTKLTRDACAIRYRRARADARGEKIRAGKPRLLAADCASCTLGAAHLRRRVPSTWPDGARVELVELRLRKGAA